MRKSILVVLMGILPVIILGQIKKTEAGSEEINVLGRISHGSYSVNKFTKEEIDKYNIKNTFGYLVEYSYENNIIFREILKLSNWIFSNETEIKIDTKSSPCFELSSIPNDVSFSLMKTNKWEVRNSVRGESICYIPLGFSTQGINVIVPISNDYSNNKKYHLINLAEGKIKLKLYRLEEY